MLCSKEVYSQGRCAFKYFRGRYRYTQNSDVGFHILITGKEGLFCLCFSQPDSSTELLDIYREYVCLQQMEKEYART